MEEGADPNFAEKAREHPILGDVEKITDVIEGRIPAEFEPEELADALARTREVTERLRAAIQRNLQNGVDYDEALDIDEIECRTRWSETIAAHSYGRFNVAIEAYEHEEFAELKKLLDEFRGLFGDLLASIEGLRSRERRNKRPRKVKQLVTTESKENEKVPMLIIEVQNLCELLERTGLSQLEGNRAGHVYHRIRQQVRELTALTQNIHGLQLLPNVSHARENAQDKRLVQRNEQLIDRVRLRLFGAAEPFKESVPDLSILVQSLSDLRDIVRRNT